MSWLGITVFVLLGALIGIVANSFRKAKGTMLQQNFAATGHFIGQTLNDIKAKMSEPSTMSACETANADKPEPFYTWAKMPYSMLFFDKNND